MHWLGRTVGLLLVATYPLGLSAQVASYPQTSAAAPATASPLPLKPQAPASGDETGKRANGMSAIITMGASLAVVLGAFFLMMWLLRRASPQRAGLLPAEAFEVLGRATLAHRHQVQLLRCGNKLLLVAVTAERANALTEITDPSEAERLADLCRSRPAAGGASFRQIVRQVEKRHA